MNMYDEAQAPVCGLPVGRIGYGLMGLTMPWLNIDHEAASHVMKTALGQGCNFWNGGIHYGTPDRNSLQLLKYYFDKHPEDREKVILSIKGARSAQTGAPTGSPEAIRESVEEALEVLGGSKKIDIFEMARVDPNVPIETSVKALAELVQEGKIGGVGLSEVSATTIRRTHAVHPISAVEVELSLFTPDALTNGVLETCHELNIPMIAYSPIGRGWLTGQFRKLDDLPPDDYRRRMPRFQPDVFEQNFKLVEAVERLAKRKAVKTAQVAIGWVVRQGAIPIPGSTKLDRIAENATPAELTDEEMKELGELLRVLPVAGERYGGEHEKLLNA